MLSSAGEESLTRPMAAATTGNIQLESQSNPIQGQAEQFILVHFPSHTRCVRAYVELLQLVNIQKANIFRDGNILVKW
jgi:hypothetical protein